MIQEQVNRDYEERIAALSRNSASAADGFSRERDNDRQLLQVIDCLSALSSTAYYTCCSTYDCYAKQWSAIQVAQLHTHTCVARCVVCREQSM